MLLFKPCDANFSIFPALLSLDWNRLNFKNNDGTEKIWEFYSKTEF